MGFYGPLIIMDLFVVNNILNNVCLSGPYDMISLYITYAYAYMYLVVPWYWVDDIGRYMILEISNNKEEFPLLTQNMTFLLM